MWPPVSQDVLDLHVGTNHVEIFWTILNVFDPLGFNWVFSNPRLPSNWPRCKLRTSNAQRTKTGLLLKLLVGFPGRSEQQHGEGWTGPVSKSCFVSCFWRIGGMAPGVKGISRRSDEVERFFWVMCQVTTSISPGPKQRQESAPPFPPGISGEEILCWMN